MNDRLKQFIQLNYPDLDVTIRDYFELYVMTNDYWSIPPADMDPHLNGNDTSYGIFRTDPNLNIFKNPKPMNDHMVYRNYDNFKRVFFNSGRMHSSAMITG